MSLYATAGVSFSLEAMSWAIVSSSTFFCCTCYNKIETHFRDNSGVRHVRHGASFSKMAHRNFRDAPEWRTRFRYGASTKSWSAINFLKIAERAIVEDHLEKIFSPCGEKLIVDDFQLNEVAPKTKKGMFSAKYFWPMTTWRTVYKNGARKFLRCAIGAGKIQARIIPAYGFDQL